MTDKFIDLQLQFSVNSIEGNLKATPVDVISLKEIFNLLNVKANALFEINKD